MREWSSCRFRSAAYAQEFLAHDALFDRRSDLTLGDVVRLANEIAWLQADGSLAATRLCQHEGCTEPARLTACRVV